MASKRERDRAHDVRRLEESPEKLAAKRLVKCAIKAGRLTRPAACSVCGLIPTPGRNGIARIQAHHADYSKPLSVKWLCPGCHYTRHHPGHAAHPRARTTTGTPRVGEANGSAQLTEETVLELRATYARGGISFVELAGPLGVSLSTVRDAVRGYTWSHLPNNFQSRPWQRPKAAAT